MFRTTVSAVRLARRPARGGGGWWCVLALVLALLWQPAPPLRAWDGNRVVALAAAHGDAAVAAARALQSAMASVVGQNELVRAQAVNDFYNHRISFRDDIDLWGQVDYWASPMETLQRGAGDCEDYAIAKYFTLVAMGLPHRKLRMVYVRVAMGGALQPHMVLALYPAPDADPLVLDSLVPEMRPASQRTDLTPVFSFNAEGIWEGVGASTVRGNPAERLSRWGDVLRKARQEGFF